MSAIHLWWVGVDTPDEVLLDAVTAEVARAFELPVSRHRSAERPADTLDVRRQQHHSTAILRWLKARRPRGARKLLALTDVDLFIPVLTFVYGEALLDGPCAVVSTARLGPMAPRHEDAPRARARLAKECVHELGHTFGLVHCAAPSCVMSRSINLAAVDGKQATFCSDCRLLYLEHLTRQGHDHE
jgi:archaemetzincin